MGCRADTVVIDTSAIVAILQDEPERSRFTEAIEREDARFISAATLLEVSMIIEARFGPEGVRDLDLFLAKARFETIPVDGPQAMVAREAFRAFGKGRHPAGLNYGDLFAYALAKSLGERLLWKGDDFGRTDLEPAAGVG